MSLSVSVEPAALEIEPGGSAVVAVQIANVSDLVETYVVVVRGLPVGGTVRAVPPTCTLKPGETGSLQVTISTDPAHPPLAGRTVLGLVVHSPYRPGVLRCEEVVLESQAVPGLTLALRPEVVGGRKPHADLLVTNRGNTVLDVELAGHDAEQAVRVVFEPPRVRLDADTRAQVRVVPHARRLIGGVPIRRQITVTATGAGAEASATLVLAQRPLVPGGAIKLASAATGVAVLVAAMVGVGLKMSDTLAKRDAAASRTTAAANHPPSTPAPTPASASTPPTTSTPPTASSSGSAPTTATGAPSPGRVVVDLTKPPLGRRAVAQRLVPDAYPGIVLSAVPATGGTCTGTGVSWLELVDPAGARGVVTGDLAQGAVGQCNDLALRIGLAAPASQVTVEFIATTTVGSGSDATSTTSSTASGNATTPASTRAATRPDPHFLPYLLRIDDRGRVVTRTASDGETVNLTISDTAGRGFRSVTLSGRPSGSGVVAVLTSIRAVGQGTAG